MKYFLLQMAWTEVTFTPHKMLYGLSLSSGVKPAFQKYRWKCGEPTHNLEPGHIHKRQISNKNILFLYTVLTIL